MAQKNDIRVDRGRGLRWVTLILVLVCELMAYTWIRTESTQAILRISQAKSTLQRMSSYRKDLNLELDRLNADDRITRIARTRLGMTSDTAAQVIYITDKDIGAGIQDCAAPFTGGVY